MKQNITFIIIGVLFSAILSALIFKANDRANIIIGMLEQAEVTRVDAIERQGESYILIYECDNGMKGQLVFDCLTDAMRFTSEVTE